MALSKCAGMFPRTATQELVRELRDSGMPPEQAEAVVRQFIGYSGVGCRNAERKLSVNSDAQICDNGLR